MKKTFALLLALSLPSLVSAQVWLTAGYGFSWLNTDGADFVIDQYNGNRDYLSTEMDKPGAFTGFGINGGFNFINIQMDARYNFRSTQLMAEGAVNGVDFERTVDLSFDSFGFGIGFGAFEEVVGFGVGLTMEITRPNISTEITGSDGVEVDVSSFATAVSPHVILLISLGEDIPIGFTIRPYYTIGISEIDYSHLNEVINPVTFANDQAEDQASRLRGFGIEFQVGLVTSLGF